jgi:hypothetical protein
MKNVIFALALLTLTACGKFESDDGSPAALPPAPPATDLVQEDIDQLVQWKNEERDLYGQAPLTKGLACSVQRVSGGSCISTSGCTGGGITLTGPAYSYLHTENFNQDSLGHSVQSQLIPTALRNIFVNTDFRIVCSGQIVVRTTAYYEFSVSSDDAAILTVNGQQVNNDGSHGMQTKSNVIALFRGVHPISVTYAKTSGRNHGLIIRSSGSLIPTRNLFH